MSETGKGKATGSRLTLFSKDFESFSHKLFTFILKKRKYDYI